MRPRKAELVFVLSSKRTYNQTPQQVADALLPLIALPHLKLTNKRVQRHAFALYASLGIDYIDAYNAAVMVQRQDTVILSFDTDFDRIPGITRHEDISLKHRQRTTSSPRFNLNDAFTAGIDKARQWISSSIRLDVPAPKEL